jgi:hypothetical protein
MVTSFVMTYTTLVQQIQAFAERENDADFNAAIPVFVLFAQRRIARELKLLGMQEYVTSTFTANSGVIVKPNRWLTTLEVNIGTSAGTVYRADVTNPGSCYFFPPTVTGGTGCTFQAYVTNQQLAQIGVVNGGAGNSGTFALTITPATDDPGTGATATATAYSGNNTRKFLLPRSYEWCRYYWPNEQLTGEPKYYADYGFNNWLIVPTPDNNLPIEIGYNQVTALLDDTTETNWITANAPDLLLYGSLLEAYPFLKDMEKQQVWQSMYERAGTGFAAEDREREQDRTGRRSRMGPPPQQAGAR